MKNIRSKMRASVRELLQDHQRVDVLEHLLEQLVVATKLHIPSELMVQLEQLPRGRAHRDKYTIVPD
jgi:hypothetical protein